jgi:hypothetical protein
MALSPFSRLEQTEQFGVLTPVSAPIGKGLAHFGAQSLPQTGADRRNGAHNPATKTRGDGAAA